MTPTKTDPKLFTILQVAKYLRIQVRRAQRLHDNFFREEANKRGFRAIPKDQIRYIVDNQTLIKMAELNLTERCKIINSTYEDIHITPRLLSRIYQLHKIKKKKAKVFKGNSSKYSP